MSHFLRDTAHGFVGLDDANGNAPESRDVLRAMTRADPAAVFVIVPVEDVMAAVLYAPVTAVGGKDAFCIGLLRGGAGDAIGGFMGVLTAFFVGALPFDDEGLCDVRKVQVGVEFGGGPNFANFDASMFTARIINKIWLLAVLEVQLDVLKKAWLVCFDGEVIMRLTFADQVVGQLALGQQGIGGHLFALDIDGLQQRDGHFDLIGTLEFFHTFYRQGGLFFGV